MKARLAFSQALLFTRLDFGFGIATLRKERLRDSNLELDPRVELEARKLSSNCSMVGKFRAPLEMEFRTSFWRKHKSPRPINEDASLRLLSTCNTYAVHARGCGNERVVSHRTGVVMTTNPGYPGQLNATTNHPRVLAPRPLPRERMHGVMIV